MTCFFCSVFIPSFWIYTERDILLEPIKKLNSYSKIFVFTWFHVLQHIWSGTVPISIWMTELWRCLSSFFFTALSVLISDNSLTKNPVVGCKAAVKRPRTRKKKKNNTPKTNNKEPNFFQLSPGNALHPDVRNRCISWIIAINASTAQTYFRCYASQLNTL